MEDYELANARAWDDSIPPPPEPIASEAPEWQVVGKARQSKKYTLTKAQRPALAKVVTRQALTPHVTPSYNGTRHQENRAPPRPAFRVPGKPPSRKWQSIRDRHFKHANTTSNEYSPPRMITDTDNDAQLLWRQHKPPVDTIRIPPILIIEDGTRYLLEGIARDMGVYIHCNAVDRNAATLEFGIWGEETDAAIAKNKLIYRIEDIMSQKGNSAGSFAKVMSLTPALRLRYENRWAREVKRSRFRQFPPPDMAFGAIGSFHWPTKEFKPEEVLGHSIEAFDVIRMDTSCYIVFVPDLSVFQVMGDEKKVKQALLRIRKSCFQLAARTINPVRAYLIRWSPTDDIPTHVCLAAYQGPSVIDARNDADDTPSWSPRSEGIESNIQKIDLNRNISNMNTERIRVTLGNALRKIHFYQGDVQLRVRLGMFLLSSYLKGDVDENPDDVLYELGEYGEMTLKSAFSGRVTEEIGDFHREAEVREMLLQSNDLLVPHDAMTASLRDVKPVYSASFVFDDTYGAFRLNMSWHQLEEKNRGDAEFILEESKWIRLGRDTNRPTSLLDMSLTDLHTGSAWQFEIVASQTTEEFKLLQKLRDFAASVKIDPAQILKQSDEKPWVRFNPFIPLIKLRSFRQEVSYRYNIQNTDYTLEVRRFQDRTFSIMESLVQKPDTTVYEPRWGLDVFRTDWDTWLSKNQRLPIGAIADWDDTFEHWFPSDIGPDVEYGGDGFEQLLEKLDKIGGMVRNSAKSKAETNEHW